MKNVHSGRHKDTLGWPARQRIAVGAARGLRYLHEECRVGCIVHRDMRPNNILITHDYEPLVFIDLWLQRQKSLNFLFIHLLDSGLVFSIRLEILV